MSRDIFVQDIPAEAHSVRDIPDDWMPSPLPFGRDRVIAVVRGLVPDADFTDPSWGQVVLPNVQIEVNVSDKSPLDSFALHVRASDTVAADNLIVRLLAELGVRAFDPEGAAETGIFGNG